MIGTMRCAAAALALITAPAVADDITGIPRTVDGDTIVVAGTKIRLEGIDAPETDQVCLDEHGARWPCGIEARDRLVGRIGGHEVVCIFAGVDRYARALGTCHIAGDNLNQWMVREGWALAFVRYSQVYVPDEQMARDGRRGLWRGAFIAPWDWRHRNQKTEVLGAHSVPITAQAQLLAPASAVGAPSPKCTIKGNVNRDGERIYHLPGQMAYARINMGAEGKRWFCTAEEAEAAGWRRALR